ncbi:MAG: excinuclease ABC subunit UvrC [Clostridiaceae bacterium]|nr:excinuclease ABC subunit UvrC [Clostridiaceae bacterium]
MNDSQHLFDARLDLVKQSPGVYLMKDATGLIIYVGKAVNLRSRLRSYFTLHPQGTGKVLAMIARIASFSTIYCENELEALILESTLIKKHQPHYNILLRDDRDYPYIKVTLNESYPRVVKAFRIGADRRQGARYFGPYLAGDVYRALQALQSVFPLKTCRRQLPRDIGKERACLNFHIGRCIGPCRGDVPVDRYRAVMEDICRFLEGRYSGLFDSLRAEMAQAAEDLDFEQAAKLRDRIQALEKLMAKQKVVSNKPEDKDILAIARNGSEIALQKMEIRQGRLVAAAAFFWPESDQTDAEVLTAFLTQHYPDAALVPPEILIPVEIDDRTALATYLGQLRGGRCGLRVPRRGRGLEMLKMAGDNAEESLRRHTLLGGSGQRAVQESLKLLSDLAANGRALHRIEAYDISNLGTRDQAAGMVVFQDGRPHRQQYRHFKLEQGDAPDDYMAMREVLERRMARLDDQGFGSRPDLLLIDGGIGHVRLAGQILEHARHDIPVAGIVKDLHHRTRGLVLPDGRQIDLRARKEEEQATEGTSDLDHAEQLALLRLLTAIQDEAHRFAGRYRSKLGKKRNTRFALEGIKGIGPSRRRLLLKEFQTIKRISQASLEDLQKLPGLGKAAARSVYEHFHPED